MASNWLQTMGIIWQLLVWNTSFFARARALAYVPVSRIRSLCSSTAIRSIQSDVHGARASGGSDFWGKQRTEEEIVKFVSDAIVGGGKDEHTYDEAWVEVISAEPPLLVVHHFLSDQMCDAIVDAARECGGLQRSTMGETQDTSDMRTSSTTWLKEGQCEVPLRQIAGMASRISCLPTGHMENLQVVHYRPGQKFDLHTDHLDSFNDLECRGRHATCLLYLNSALPNAEGKGGETANEEVAPLTGGETWFPEFDAKITPQKGSALFWWNTVQRPGQFGYDKEMNLNVDMKLRHAGLPVLTGEKWICNRWLHPIDIGSGVRGSNV